MLCIGNDNYTGIAARDTANALRVLAGAVRGVAAGTKNPKTQEYILTTAQTVCLLLILVGVVITFLSCYLGDGSECWTYSRS